MDACPSTEILDEYREGNLTGRTLVEFLDHISRCDPCSQFAEEVRQQELFDDLKRARRQCTATPRFELKTDTVDPGFYAALRERGYEVLGEISRGGQGIVYKASQLETNRIVAIKQFFGSSIESDSDRERFKQEIELIASLDNPNIVTVFDGGQTANSQFLVMEFIEGVPLGEYWQSEVVQYSDSGKVPRVAIRKSLEIVRKICRAINHLHQNGIIHRDLKPENILINSEFEPKVLDLGLAKPVEEKRSNSLTKNGEFLGTLAYASPEQAMVDPNLVDTRSDVYSLGVILYEMITLRLPFEVSDGLYEVVNRICKQEPRRPKLINGAIETDVETIILKSLSKAPERRYQSVDQLGTDIELYLNNRPIEAMRDSKLYVIKKTLQRHKPIAILAGLLVCTGIFSLCFSLLMWSNAVEQRDAAKAAEVNESKSRDAAETQAYIANLIATKSLFFANDIAEAKRRLQMTKPDRRGWEYDYWLARTDSSEQTLSVHELFISDFSFLDQRPKVVSVAGDQSLKVWSIVDPNDQIEVEFDSRPSICCASLDDSLVGCVVGNKEVRFLDAETLEARGEVQLSFNVRTAAFLKDNRMIVAGWDDDSTSWFAILDAESGDVVRYESEVLYPTAISIHPQEMIAAIGGQSTALLDLDTFKFEALKVSGGASSLTFASDGSQIAIGVKRDVLLVDFETGLETCRFRGPDKEITDITISPSAEWVAASFVDGSIRSWNIQSGKAVDDFVGHEQKVTAVQFMDGGARILSSSYDGTFKIWRTNEVRNPSRFQHHTHMVRDIEFTSDGQQIVTVGEDSNCVIWDVRTGDVVRRLRHGSPLFGASLSPDGLTLAICGDDNVIRLVSLENGSSRVLTGHEDRVHSVRFHHDGKRLVSCSRDQAVIVWEVATGEVVQKLEGHPTCVHAAAFDASGERIVSRCHTKLRFWDVESGACTSERDLRIGDEDYSLEFHPNGNYLGVGTSIPGFGRGFVSLIDTETFQPVGSLEQHNAPITSLDFSPDGKRAVTSSIDSVKVWDLSTMEEVTSLDGIEGEVTCVSFSPDGKLIAAGFKDGAVMVWNSDPDH